MSGKPVVEYDSYAYHHAIMMGVGAIVRTFNHPSSAVSNTMYVMTSAVISCDDDGNFETLNTIYKPR